MARLVCDKAAYRSLWRMISCSARLCCVMSRPTPRDALTTLRRVVDACFFHATVSNHRRFIITLMVEALDTNPRLSEEFRRILRGMRSYLAEVVRRGQRE